MSLKTQKIGGEIDYNLKILKLDQQRLIDEITQLHNDLNNKSETNDVNQLEKKYEYLFNNLPKVFNILIENPSMPLDMFIMMINKAYKIGNKEVDPQQTSIDIAKKLHYLYTNKNTN